LPKDNAKICIVTASIPPVFAGGGLRAYHYARRLHEEKKLAFILTRQPHPDYEIWKEWRESEALSKKKITRVPSIRGHKQGLLSSIWRIWSEYVVLLLHITYHLLHHRDSFEIVHCFGAGNMLSLYAVGVGKALGKKTVLEMTLLGSDDPVSIQKNDSIGVKGHFRVWLFSMADVVISKSPALSSTYMSSDLNTEKLREISNPVDVHRFCPPSENEKLRLRGRLNLRAKQKQPVILFVGNIVKRKGVDLLVDSFAEVVKTHSDVLLLLVGSTNFTRENGGDFAAKMKRRVNDLGLADQVVFTGLVNNVEEYMKASDVFVFPSRREGLPNVLLEAMATGLPAVVLNIEGITKYVIRNREEGIVIENEDPMEFALAINELLDNRPLYEKISKNARRRVKVKFSNEIIDRQYAKIYKALRSHT
jgi:glycosyltransferase involved in cell wall biosynthesis